MLTSPEISNEMFTKCVDERMKAPKERRIDIFAKIPKSKIRTRLEKIKVKGNTLDAIKEDSQAFGLLVGKVQSPNEALKYPLTTVPLALAESDQTLCQQSTKATLHRFFHEKSDSVVKVNEADGLNLLSDWKPKDVTCTKSLSIIFDSYSSTSIKQSILVKRGHPGWGLTERTSSILDEIE